MATLWVIATPIGNLQDTSPRALTLLRDVHTIFAEDTRRTITLLRHFGIKTPLVSLHQHNERERAQQLVSLLQAGHHVGLVSDAGTPCLSDPGGWAVAAAWEAGARVLPCPGPSALAAALSVAGFEQADPNVRFIGFFPTKKATQDICLERLQSEEAITIFFEGPHRIEATLELLAKAIPERVICVCRELTKMHEETVRGTAAVLLEWARAGVKGEFTVVVAPAPPKPTTVDETMDLDQHIVQCLQAGLSKKDAAAAVAAIFDRSKREVYQRVLSLSADLK